jgi:hypothetical protein
MTILNTPPELLDTRDDLSGRVRHSLNFAAHDLASLITRPLFNAALLNELLQLTGAVKADQLIALHPVVT